MSETNNQNENQTAEQNGEQSQQSISNLEQSEATENQKQEENQPQPQQQQQQQENQDVQKSNEESNSQKIESETAQQGVSNTNTEENNQAQQSEQQQQQEQQEQQEGQTDSGQEQQQQIQQQEQPQQPQIQSEQQPQQQMTAQPEQQPQPQPQPQQQQQPDMQQQPGMPQQPMPAQQPQMQPGQPQPQPQPQQPAGQMQMGGGHMPQRAPDDFDSSQCRNLYVGNLDPRVTRELLHQIFSTVGMVASCKLILDKNTGKSAGYGFVEFYDHQSAEQAMTTLNGKQVYDYEIKINWAYTSQQREDTSNHFHIFVGDLAPDIDDQTLYQAFSAFSSISDARVLWDQTTGRSRGYGFVAFREKSDAEQAIKTMTGVWLSSKAIRCNWAHQRGPTRPDGENANLGTADYATVFYRASYGNTTVYIGNLAPEVQERTLMTYFYRFGNIEDIRLHKEKAYGFVRFSSHENATQAIVYMNGTELMGKRIKVSWGKEKNSSMMGGYPMGGMPMGYPGMPGMYPYAMPGQDQMAAYYGMQGYDPSFAAASAQSGSQGSVGPMKRSGSAASGRFQPYSQSGQSQQ